MLTVDLEEAGYETRAPVLKDVRFTVHPGELVGLIGPNGAGKSTAIKSILGVTPYVKGKVDVGIYAYIPEHPIFYESITLWEHIEFLLTTLDSEETEILDEANRLLDLFGLEQVKHHYPESFSKGMQQKGMIVLALLKKPDLYIIDEPFIGLDPKATKKLLHVLDLELARGAGILMSTHVLDTAEKICDRFLLLSHGKLITQGTMEDIRMDSHLTDGSLFDCFDVLTGDDSK